MRPVEFRRTGPGGGGRTFRSGCFEAPEGSGPETEVKVASDEKNVTSKVETKERPFGIFQ